MDLPSLHVTTLSSSKGDSDHHHFLILLLSAVNILLLVIVFLIIGDPISKHFLKITPISADTPITRFSLVSPEENTTVSEVVPLVTTISNGPQVISAKLAVDGQEVQSSFNQETEKLVIFWDSKKVANGSHDIIVTASDDEGSISQLYASFNVENTSDLKTPIR